MSKHNLAGHELVIVEKLVRQAGALVREYYDKGADVDWKGVNDPVTTADRAANEFLVSELSKAFPADGIIAEESQDNVERLDRERVWIIDPLDGTREFVDHIGEFSVMVGLAIAGKPVLGVVYQPVVDLLYRGLVGQVAEVVERGQARPLAVSAVADPAEMRMVASRSHRNPLVAEVREALGVTRDRPSGSVGLKVGLLGTRECDLYIHPAPGLKEWDTCAPDAILRAAGGAISDAWGRPLQYNKPDVRQRYGLIASNGLIHEQIVATTIRAAGQAGYDAGNGFW